MTLYEMKGSHLFQFIAPNGFNHAVFNKAHGIQDENLDLKKFTTYLLPDEEMAEMTAEMDAKDMSATKMKDLFSLSPGKNCSWSTISATVGKWN